MERITYRLLRHAKDAVWYLDYGIWLLFSPYKFKRLPRDIQSVVVIEDIGLGDLLVSTPVFRALKKKYGKVDVLVKPGMQDVLKGNPHVDNAITKVERNYDLGVILHARTNGNYTLSKQLKEKCRFRIGCTRVGFKEGKGFFLNRKTRPTFNIKTKVQDNLDVVRTIGVDGDEYLEAYTNFVPPVKDYILLHTHGAYETHNWSKEKWARLADQLNTPIVFTGTDKGYVHDIMQKMKRKDAIDATGTTIQEYFGWMKQARAVVTVDTSAMHVAAAFNKKVISLFGPGDPRIWKPHCQESIVIQKGDCHSCHKNYCALGDHRCMQLITPEDILAKVTP